MRGLQGWGGDRLLDAYAEERRATAWWHLEASRRHMGVRIQISELYAAAGDLLAEGPEGDARRAELARKIEELGNAENESWGVEYGYRYDGSPVVAHEGDAPVVDPLTYRANTVPGTRLPHVFLADGEPIHDKLGLFFTLVVLDDTDTAAMEQAATDAGVPVDVLRLGRPDLRGIYERNLILVRPDQHVAWRGDELPGDCRGVNGGVKSCHAAAQKSATCGARMRPPGGLRPERGSHARVAIFEGRQPAFRARLWARR